MLRNGYTGRVACACVRVWHIENGLSILFNPFIYFPVGRWEVWCYAPPPTTLVHTDTHTYIHTRAHARNSILHKQPLQLFLHNCGTNRVTSVASLDQLTSESHVVRGRGQGVSKRGWMGGKGVVVLPLPSPKLPFTHHRLSPPPSLSLSLSNTRNYPSLSLRQDCT